MILIKIHSSVFERLEMSIIIRVRSSNGTQRISISPTSPFSEFVKMLSEKCAVPLDQLYVYRDLKDKNPLGNFRTRQSLKNLRLNHGDMLFIKSRIETPDSSVTSMDSNMTSLSHVALDDVDNKLSNCDGLISRKLNPQLCNHNENGQCVHCSPLEPYDDDYLKENKIKHMSYYSYLKKRKSGSDGKFVQMEDIDCTIKPGCMKHPPWPEGICTQCQPKAVTLNQQEYRHSDFVEFESPEIVENFINYWRETGLQRVGFLYGRYDVESHVPLGIKSVVSFIYEPPQNSDQKSIEFLDDPYRCVVDDIAKLLGLYCVGWIFTDLQALSISDGTVKNLRNGKTFFLSAQECIHAAYFQNKYPSPSKLSKSGKFGSKFVTVCISGNESNTIEMFAYQVSNQCMALVRDNILLPAREHPGLAYVKLSSAEQYVPDVFFREKDEYGNIVTKEARPLPVEYLLLQLPTGTPKDGHKPLLPGGTRPPNFPVVNRESLDMEVFKRYYRAQPDEFFLESLSDINVLFFLHTNDTLSFQDNLAEICSAIVKGDRETAQTFKESPTWATLEQILAVDTVLTASNGSTWSCSICTLINESDKTVCEACGTPKS